MVPSFSRSLGTFQLSLQWGGFGFIRMSDISLIPHQGKGAYRNMCEEGVTPLQDWVLTIESVKRG